MKICEYHPRISYYVGGAELVAIDQIKRLSKNHEITILTSRTNKQTEQFKNLFNLFDINTITLYNPFQDSFFENLKDTNINKWDIESLFLAKEAYSFFEDNKFDLVITHYSIDNLALPSDVNNVLHLHGVPPEWKILDKLSIEKTNFFVSVADFITNGWNKFYDLGEVPLCYNGIDTNKFYDKNLQKDIDILYIGRLVPYKRVDVLVKSLSKKRNLKVVIGGEGSEKNKLEKIAEYYGSDIDFKGYIPDEKIVDYYNRSKIFVHTADTREGVVTTVLEAMACGVIPVVSASCGVLEAVEDNVNGFTFEPLNSLELSEKINYVLDNFSRLDGFRFKVKSTINEKFDCNKTISKLEEIYENMVNKNGG
ncbi:glycosyltransferase family 4 protein [Candidatus Woesearchaeota archaeon]|nr:glycosyltransferase family 4 protein [Candidatus Woesearchaeota archaeon]